MFDNIVKIMVQSKIEQVLILNFLLNQIKLSRINFEY